MLRISQIKLNISYSRKDIENAVLKKLRIKNTRLLDFIIVKKSIDARDKNNINYILTVDAKTDCDDVILNRNTNPHVAAAPENNYVYPEHGSKILKNRPVIIGMGPAGLFAAYFLAEQGYCPIVIERGEAVEDRLISVQKFWNTGELNPCSNIQYGEGGAGTFSDGKLNTGVNDPKGRNGKVLKTFVKNGAQEEILYNNKPHVGTDVLMTVISNMRKQIIANGGEVRFNTCFKGFITEGNTLTGIEVNDGEIIKCNIAILAIGHSARDTFSYIIKNSGLLTEAKPFAVGVRVEHLQNEINIAQYGIKSADKLPPADYKLTYKSKAGNSVYSFCMCPGGHVVNSSSEEGYTCINGMSYSKRDSQNANSAIVVAVKPSDNPEKNIAFQRELEKKTFIEGNGKIVSQRFEDFENGRISADYGRITPVHKGMTVLSDIHNILPEYICRDIIEAMHYFGHKIKDFDNPDVILSAVETRTSSPIRILRNENMQANINGIYPIGEGAGYAGGITSAAIDGIKAFEEICSLYKEFK